MVGLGEVAGAGVHRLLASAQARSAVSLVVPTALDLLDLDILAAPEWLATPDLMTDIYCCGMRCIKQ